MKDEKVTKSKRQSRKHVSQKPESTKNSSPPSENSYSTAVETKDQSVPVEEMLVSPDLPRTTVTIIRPASMQRQDSITGRASDIVESMKDKTGEAIDSIMSATGLGVSRTVSDIDSEPVVIPIIEQKGATETKSYPEGITIEKRQVERKKNIEVKINYDEIFVNGKEIGTSVGDTFREIRDKILEIVSFDQDRDEKELEKIKGDMVPLLGNDTEMEKVIPLYAEQVVISKRMVKIADLTIRKRKVTETSKVNIDLITEELTIRNPTGGGASSFEKDE